MASTWPLRAQARASIFFLHAFFSSLPPEIKTSAQPPSPPSTPPTPERRQYQTLLLPPRMKEKDARFSAANRDGPRLPNPPPRSAALRARASDVGAASPGRQRLSGEP